MRRPGKETGQVPGPRLSPSGPAKLYHDKNIFHLSIFGGLIVATKTQGTTAVDFSPEKITAFLALWAPEHRQAIKDFLWQIETEPSPVPPQKDTGGSSRGCCPPPSRNET